MRVRVTRRCSGADSPGARVRTATLLTLLIGIVPGVTEAQADSDDGPQCHSSSWYASGTLQERLEWDCRLAADLPAFGALRVDGRPAVDRGIGIGPAWFESRYNSAWPYLEWGRGAWAGRGMTWRAGFATEVRIGPVRVRMQPE